jgi:hypothetical protein
MCLLLRPRRLRRSLPIRHSNPRPARHLRTSLLPRPTWPLRTSVLQSLLPPRCLLTTRLHRRLPTSPSSRRSRPVLPRHLRSPLLRRLPVRGLRTHRPTRLLHLTPRHRRPIHLRRRVSTALHRATGLRRGRTRVLCRPCSARHLPARVVGSTARRLLRLTTNGRSLLGHRPTGRLLHRLLT